jgi:hypothetical protein
VERENIVKWGEALRLHSASRHLPVEAKLLKQFGIERTKIEAPVPFFFTVFKEGRKQSPRICFGKNKK